MNMIALNREVQDAERLAARLADALADWIEHPRGPKRRQAIPGPQGQVHRVRLVVLLSATVWNRTPASFERRSARAFPAPAPASGSSERELPRTRHLIGAILFHAAREVEKVSLRRVPGRVKF
jgi:plasmid stabilization system protein ParE